MRWKILLSIPMLFMFSGCSASYSTGYTLQNGKPAIYTPVCSGDTVKYFGVVARNGNSADAIIWEIESVGGNTNFFVLGEAPEGYRVVREHGNVNNFPLDFKYQAGNGHYESNLIDFSDAENGVLKSSGAVTTRSELDADMARKWC